GIVLKNSFFKNSLLYLLTCLILLSSTGLVGNTILIIRAGSTVYDFIDHASEAQWSSGAGALPFPGDPSDNRGFTRHVYNALLEDGKTWSKVLETHPQWVSGGWIMGVYPQQTVQSNTQLTVRIGFLSGATGTDGVRFDVYFDEYRGLNVAPLRHTVLSQTATLDGKLDLVTRDLSSIAGKKGNFILYVYAGQTSNRDWAVWAEARIEMKPLPDLVITDIWDSDGLIHYKVKNIGDAATTLPGMPTKSFQNCLSVNGQQVAKHAITQVLQPGQEVEGIFDYTWQLAPGEHAIRVCADCEQNIDEFKEDNNCLEEKWLKENLPDLIITEIRCDRNNSMIGYVLKNIGNEVAKGNQSTTLYVDGKEVAHDPVGVDLKPGETFESWFKNYEWPECRNITVKVCSDNFNQVRELNEKNNCLEKTCISYPVPILIISGPSAVSITQDSATIKWVTNKNSDSMVVYSDRSTGEEKTVYDPSLVKDHALRITGLKPMTTYRFYVKSKDSCGNFAVSRNMAFETTSPPDKEKPSVTLFLPEKLVGIVNILADVSDNVGVGGVMFSIDGVIKFIDFSPPYIWVCNTTLFPNGVHDFDAIAFDAAGNRAISVKNGTINNPAPDTNPPIVDIVKPDREWVHGLVQIEAIIQDREYHAIPAGHIQEAELYIDGVLVKRWLYTPFRFDPLTKETITVPYTSSLTFTHLWNATGLEPNSEHAIEVKAWDDSGNYGYDSVRVKIFSIVSIEEHLESIRIGRIKIVDIQVTREVVRHEVYQTAYLVTLYVRNTGTATLYNLTLRDDVSGFQVIPHTAFMSVSFAPSFWTSTVIFKPPGEAALPPGGVATIQYFAVPILFAPTIPDDCYIFGWLPTSVSFSCDGMNYGRSFELSHHPEDLSSVLRNADYIIITHPSRLFSCNLGDESGVNSLLVQMAELARLKNGVLGYLRGELASDEIKSFISPSGAWASRLSPVFRSPDPERGRYAYVLIVGEDEIVPSFKIYAPGFATEHTGDFIDISDHPYTDVLLCDNLPDIVVGRIIGNTSRELINPIRASIDVYLGLADYDGSDALFVTGYEDTWEGHIINTERGKIFLLWLRNTVLRVPIRVSTVHTEYYTTKHSMLAEALRIKGPDDGGARFEADLSGYSTEQLAIWLLDSEGEHWASWAITYQEFTDSEGRRHRWAPAYVGDEEVERALRIAERIQHTRENRGGDYGYTYTYLSGGSNVLARIAREVKSQTPNKDIIVFLGHGGPGSWACVLDDWSWSNCPIEPISFGTSHPIVLAFSCLTGDYRGSESIARAFLRNGAVVYIGSTEVSLCCHNEELVRSRLWSFWQGMGPIAAAFKNVKTWMMRQGGNWRYTCYEYNFYGDPKFGA
ncbi:MAG: CARDB domain-containing protein, partial [Thermoproteota archaeon]